MFTMQQGECVGFYDADGTTHINIVDRSRKFRKSRLKFRQPRIRYGFEFSFEWSQSEKNKETLRRLSNALGVRGQKLYANRKKGTSTAKFYLTSSAGQKFLSILKKHKPMLPSKRRDYLLTLEIQRLLSQQKNQTNTGLITILALVFKMSNQQRVDAKKTTIIGRKRNLESYIQSLGATQVEREVGLSAAEAIASKVEAEVTYLTKKLPSSRLTMGYVRGFLWGDGGFSLGFTKLKTGYIQMNPTVTFTDPCEPFLQCIKRALGAGTIVKVGPRNGSCFQLRLRSWSHLEEIVLPKLGEAIHPPYFLQRLQKLSYNVKNKVFYVALALQQRDLHKTPTGFTAIVERCYDMCGSGSHDAHWGSSQNLIALGLAYFNQSKTRSVDKLLLRLRKRSIK